MIYNIANKSDVMLLTEVTPFTNAIYPNIN